MMFVIGPRRISAWSFVKGPRPIGFSHTRQVNVDVNISDLRPRFEVFASKRSKKEDIIKAKESFKKNSPSKSDFNRKGFEDSSLAKSHTLLDHNEETSSNFVKKNLDGKSSFQSPSRDVVLRSCAITSAVMLALGATLREVTHIAFIERWGLVKLDPFVEVSYNYFEAWHAELIIGIVILISTSRYILLNTWKDLSDSSEAANQQVLGQLQPLDYVFVAFLPGIGEEFLFRGALLPVLGLEWRTSLIVGVVFGCLHLGNGRRFSFAVWATMVGSVYGMSTIWSKSLVVPMASHSLNNLIGGILWRHFRSKKWQ